MSLSVAPAPLARRRRPFPARQLSLMALLCQACEHEDATLDERRTLRLMARGVAARISAVPTTGELVSETRGRR